MKNDPSLDLIEEIRDTKRGRDFFSDMRSDYERDIADRDGWLQKIEHFRARRYCMEDRDPTYPWPGSSSIVLPFIDKKIDEIKPAYVGLVSQARPPCTVLAIAPEFQEKTERIELFISWLVKFGSPNFLEQVSLGVDDLLEKGRCIFKTMWFFSTVRCAQILDRARLPEKLRRLVVAQSPKEANLLHLLTGGPQNGGPPIIDRGQFNDLVPQIKEVLHETLGLDPKDKDDGPAISEVLSWLRNGAKDPIRVDSNQVRDNVPGIAAVDPRDLIMPSYARDDIESVESYTEVMRYSRLRFEQEAAQAGWNQAAVKSVLEAYENRGGDRSQKTNYIGSDESQREGVSSIERGIIEVRATYAWYKPDSGPPRKTKLLWCDKAKEIPLKFSEFVRPSGHWPHYSAVFEKNKDRWYSARGIPEKIDDIDWEITHQHRYKLNRATIATAPTVLFNPGGIVNPETWHYIPGQMMPARNPMVDARVLEFPQQDVTFEREEQNLITWGDGYLGSAESSMLSSNNRLSEPRTAFEIQAIQSKARQALSLRGMLFQQGAMQPIYREMLDLFIAHGDENIYIRVTESDPIHLSKEDLRGQYVLQCTGTIGESDPEVEEQKALARLSVLQQVSPLLGDQYEINLSEAVRDWLEKSNVRLSNRILRKRTPEEVQQIQQERRQMQASQAMMAAQGMKPMEAPPMQLAAGQ